MKRRVLSLCLAGALLAGFFGCTQPEPATSAAPQPTPAATAVPTPAAETPVVSAAALPSLLGEMETLYDPELVPNVPAFAIADDFSNLANADELAYWSEEARAALRENGALTAAACAVYSPYGSVVPFVAVRPGFRRAGRGARVLRALLSRVPGPVYLVPRDGLDAFYRPFLREPSL